MTWTSPGILLLAAHSLTCVACQSADVPPTAGHSAPSAVGASESPRYDSGATTGAAAPDVVRFSTEESSVVELVNAVRLTGADCGLRGRAPPVRPLARSPRLVAAARRHAVEMATRGYFGHSTAHGLPFRERLVLAAGETTGPAAENLAWGQPTPEAVVRDWLASDEHCSALMDGRYQETGVALHEERRRRFWVQLFAARAGNSPRAGSAEAQP